MASDPTKSRDPGVDATLSATEVSDEAGERAGRDAPPPPDLAMDATQAQRPAGTEDTLAAQATVSAPGAGPRADSNDHDEVELPTVSRQSYSRGAEVARGGMGRIVAAHDLRLRRPVAVKELLSSSVVAQTRFAREALVTARLQHPAIVPIYEAGRWPNGEPFYAMKLVEGRSLDAVIAETESFAERLGFLRNVIAVADALAYAHSQGIIHRDLKPANVLLGEFGESVVIDWGLAKIVGESIEEPGGAPDSLPDSIRDGLTVDGSVLGTPAYMAPEQARGTEVDARADVYSLGALLYHVLTGAPAYSSRDSRNLLAQVVRGAAPPVAEREPLVPRDLAAIVDKAMAHDPADRYPTAAELVADLKRFETGQLVSVRTYSAPALIWRWVKRHAATVSVAAVALVLMAVLGALAITRIVRERDTAEEQRALATARQVEAETQRGVAQARVEEVTLLQARAALETDPTRALAWLKRIDVRAERLPTAREIAQRALTLGVAEHVFQSPGDRPITRAVFSPDGTQIAAIWGGNDVLLFASSSGDARLLKGIDAILHDLAYSPDGRRLAGAANNGSVLVWDVRTGEVDDRPGDGNAATHVAFSPNARWLAAAGADGAIDIWNRDTGARRAIQVSKLAITALVFVGDGRTAVASDANGQIVRIDAPTGEQRVLGRHRGEVKTLAASPDGALLASGGIDAVVRLWSLADGSVRELRGHDKTVRAAGFSPDGRLLATASEDRTVRLWPVAGGASRVLRGHDGDVLAVSFDASGERVVSTGTDATARIWDVATGRARVLRGHLRQIQTHALSRSGILATGDLGGRLRLWQLRRADSRLLIAHGDVARGLDVSPDGRYVASGGYDRAVGIADLDSGTSRLLHGHEAPVFDVAVLPDDTGVVSVADDHTVRLWGLQSDARRILFRHPARIWQVEVEPHSQLIGIWAEDGVARVRSLDGTTDRSFGSETTPALRLRFSPLGNAVATADYAGHITLWSLDGGGSRKMSGPKVQIMDLRFSPTGDRIAICGHDGTVALFDVASGDSRILPGSCEPYAELAFSSDASRLAVADRDFALRIVDVANGDSQLLAGHTDRVFRIAFLGDDRFVASSSADETIRVWNLATGSSRVLTDHRDGVVRLLAMPDGRSLVSAARDGDVRLWSDPLQDPVPLQPRRFAKWLAEVTSATLVPGGEQVSSPSPSLSEQGRRDAAK